jgi:hypothetical protein
MSKEGEDRTHKEPMVHIRPVQDSVAQAEDVAQADEEMIEEEALKCNHTGIEVDQEIDLHLEVIKDRLTQPITFVTTETAMKTEDRTEKRRGLKVGDRKLARIISNVMIICSLKNIMSALKIIMVRT